MMNRDQQTRKALRLLAPARPQRAECKHDIEVALDRVERRTTAAQVFQVAGSKKGKAAVRRYSAALRRLRAAYHSLDPAIRPWFSLAETAYVRGMPTLIDREIAIAEGFLARPSTLQRRDASRNNAAVAAAHDLLIWWHSKPTVSRSGNWARLAKILAGNLTVDLFEHLRAFKRHPDGVVEKLRGAHSIIYLTRRPEPGIK